uniref:RNA-directed RNA polymerase n=1 Tax=Beihai levi-like virus 34 TaxID=1922420 RepID=A0A1L3KI57_9VIRU|nr:hypothetical protein [Beihai levi-like virus 34]
MAKPIKIPKVSEESKIDFNSRVAMTLYDEINTPVSLLCKKHLMDGDIESLISMDVNPSDYDNAWDFSIDYQAVSFLKKGDFHRSGIDTAKVALEKFLESEAQCAKTNSNLKDDIRPYSDIVFRAQQIISHMLGSTPNMEGRFEFGPGATSAVKGSFVTIPDKLEQHIVCPFGSINLVREFYTKSAPRLIEGMISGDTHFGPCCQTGNSLHIEVLDYNELTFVPKSAKTDRPICIEPHSLIPLQKYLGKKIRYSLLKGGINLDTQWKLNRRLAKQGSIDGSNATIDLSSASDTISIAAVMELLPLPWFELLSESRSPFTKLPSGEIIENDKFSSMGNGYTFELETLLFYALARAVCEKHDVYNIETMSVFGDDIIVPISAYKDLVNVLEAFGFSLNKEKTFSSGPFRESCGADFFNGVNVRPYFYKKGIKYETDKFSVCNGLLAWNRRNYGDFRVKDLYSFKTIEYIIRSIKKPFRFAGPVHIGNGCIHISQQECFEYDMHGRKDQFGVSTCYAAVPCFREKDVRKITSNSLIQVLSVLYGSSQRVPLRGVVGFNVKKTQPAIW